MDMIAAEPRITLTRLAKELKMPVSEVFDLIQDVEKEYKLQGMWI